MAAKAAVAAAATGKALTKGQFLAAVAEKSGVPRKEVAAVVDGMSDVIRDQLGKKGAGKVTIPGLVLIKTLKKPATKAGTKPNPFKPGEMMEVKAKPASTVVKVRPVKALKEMV